MDNKKLWILTARNVVKFCRVSIEISNCKKQSVHKMKVRQTTVKSNKNIKVVVTN